MGWLEEEKFRRKKPEFRQKPKHFNLCPINLDSYLITTLLTLTSNHGNKMKQNNNFDDLPIKETISGCHQYTWYYMVLNQSCKRFSIFRTQVIIIRTN